MHLEAEQRRRKKRLGSKIKGADKVPEDLGEELGFDGKACCKSLKVSGRERHCAVYQRLYA